jgi:hypothetical protein
MILSKRFNMYLCLTITLSVETTILLFTDGQSLAPHVAAGLFGAGVGLCLLYWKNRNLLDPKKLLPRLDDLRLHRWFGGKEVKASMRRWIAPYRLAFGLAVVFGPIAGLLWWTNPQGSTPYGMLVSAWILPFSAFYLWAVLSVEQTISSIWLGMLQKSCLPPAKTPKYSPEWWRNRLAQAIGVPTIMLRLPDMACERGARWDGHDGQWLHAKPNVPHIHRYGQTWERTQKTYIGWIFHHDANAISLTSIRRVYRRRHLGEWYATVDPSIIIRRQGLNYVWSKLRTSEVDKRMEDRNVSNLLRVAK